MFGKGLPLGSDYPPRANLCRRRRALNEARVVAVGHETYFLALGFVRIGESQRTRSLANFGLRHRAERKKRARKLALAEATKTCSAQGREVAVTQLDNSGDIGRAAGPLALRGETTLVFRCVARPQ